MIRYIRADGQVVITCVGSKIIVVDKLRETRVEVTAEEAMGMLAGYAWVLDMESNYKEGEEQ